MGMCLDSQAVSACSNCSSCARRDKASYACSMAWVNNHRKMRQLVQYRNRSDVKGVSRVGLKRPDAALAQDDFPVPLAHDVLGSKKKFLIGRPHPPFQEYRLSLFSCFLEEGIVLHVSCSYLQDISILCDKLDIARVKHLGDDAKARSSSCLCKHLQPCFPQPLKVIGACPRLERPTPQKMGSCLLHFFSDCDDLLFRFH